MKNLLFFLCGVLLSLVTFSQTAATNTGTLFINSGSDIFYAEGDFTNTSTLLTNNGLLYVKGTLTNNQTPATIGTGTLHLNGSSAQSVAGSAVFKTYHLNTNNASGITLNNDLSISGTHTFTAGDIASSATPNYLIYESGSATSGATDARHVTGWIKKIGSTAFTFPTGNGTYLRSIAIGNLSGSIEFNCTYSGATTNTSNLQSPLVSINPGEYWTLNNITGGGSTAEVTLNWDHSKIAFPNYTLADIRSAQYTSSNWASTGGTATGNVTTMGSITSSSLSVFGPLSIGSVSTVVPLYYISFSAQRKTGYNLVEWKTTNEVNVNQHEVQRSSNHAAFVTIGMLPARNTTNTETYNFYDRDLIDGLVYYRIKSVDFDGKTMYSKVASVANSNMNETISVKNNPAKETINLVLTNTKNTSFVYQLIATNGSIVQQGNLYYTGNGTLSIPLHASVHTGSYILVINDGKKLFTQKIIIY